MVNNSLRIQNSQDMRKVEFYDVNGNLIRYGFLPVGADLNFFADYNVANFDGWYYNGMPFDSSGTYNIDGDITVVARWTGKTYTVYLNANSGTGVPGSVSVIYGSVYSLPTPTRDGYSFDGWYTSRNGGSYYSSFGTWNETSGKTLYAHWTKLPDSE